MATERPLEGKVAIVTGGVRRLGKGMALAFARDGASVVINARVVARGGRAGRRRGGSGRRPRRMVYLADVTDEAAVNKMVDATVAKFGRVDILVNNAANRAEAPFLRDDLQAVARHPRRHPRRRVPVLARGAAAHGQEQVRTHHQSGRRVEPPRRARPRPCRRRQGRHRRLHARAGVGIRAAWRHRELHRARPHRRRSARRRPGRASGTIRRSAAKARSTTCRRWCGSCASRTTATSPARPSM